MGKIPTVGADGTNYEEVCPICGKKGNARSEYCMRNADEQLCPNPNEKCNNRSKTYPDRRQCAGYSAGYIGSGPNLGSNIMRGGAYILKDKSTHPLYTGKSSIEAHHLITSETMCNTKWKKACEITGYNVNCKLNGIFLPSKMIVACHAYLQRHKGDHELGDGDGMTYVAAVEAELENIIDSFKSENKPCDEKTADDIVKSLNRLSKDKILKKIIDAKKFIWTIAWDGFNYEIGGIGCAGSEDMDGKRKMLKEKLEETLEKLNKKDTFIHTNKYNYDDMKQMRNELLDTLGRAMCDMNRIHTPKNEDPKKELTAVQIAKIGSFKREIGH